MGGGVRVLVGEGGGGDFFWVSDFFVSGALGAM